MCRSPSFIHNPYGPDTYRIPVPCRKCWQCEQNRINDYVGRSLCEGFYSDWVYTVTLTYADQEDFSHRVIVPIHAQKWVRSLRRRGHKFKYFIAGEYGERKGRAHFHAVLFGNGKAPNWPHERNHNCDSWPHGFIFVDKKGDYRSVRYALKYVQKDAAQKTWYSMSKKPPLGHEWFQAKAVRDAQMGLLPSTFAYRPPGGHKKREYIMSGATRREYLRRVLIEYGYVNKERRKKLSEWCRAIFDSVAKWEHLQVIQDFSKEPEMQKVFLEAFAADLDQRRMSERDADAAWLKNLLPGQSASD